MRAIVMRLVGLASGYPSPFDGEWLIEYDPERLGDAGHPYTAHIVTTSDLAKARRFENVAEAHRCWSQIPNRLPVRPDGRPNRPLTAFTIELRRLPEGG